jgi:hypothetical protein
VKNRLWAGFPREKSAIPQVMPGDGLTTVRFTLSFSPLQGKSLYNNASLR